MIITFVGAGAMGQALKSAVRPEHAAYSWDNVPEKNPGQKPLTEAIPSSDAVFLCIPSSSLAEAAAACCGLIKPGAIVYSVSKGLEPDGRHAGRVLQPLLGNERYALLGGPLMATELQQGQGGRAVVASPAAAALSVCQNIFSPEKINFEYTPDVASVALAGVWKNIYTLLIGMAEGLGYGKNIQGYLAGRAIAEGTAVARLLHISEEVFAGPAGIGDFLATAFSPLSQNREAGRLIALGQKPKTTEGIKSLGPFSALIGTTDSLPLLQAVTLAVTGSQNVKEIVKNLTISPVQA